MKNSISKDNNLSSTILKYHNTPLTKKFIDSQTTENKILIAEALFHYFKNSNFPYPNCSNKELKNDWKKLKDLDSNKIIREDGALSQSLRPGIKLFKQFGKSYFHVKKKKKNSKTMMEAFLNDDLLMKTIRNRLGVEDFIGFNITNNMMLQGLRNSYSSASISLFKPCISKFIYDRFTPPNGIVFDYSMGMGQRLMGALASKNNLTYLATDPWDKAHEDNNNILNFIKSIDNVNEPILKQICSTKAKEVFPQFENKVDLSFSSPPYYDAEVFSNDSTQAYQCSYDEFINTWWRNTVDNIKFLSKDNALLAINISYKVGKHNILDDMLQICEMFGFKEQERFLIKSYRKHQSKDNPLKYEPIIILNR